MLSPVLSIFFTPQCNIDISQGKKTRSSLIKIVCRSPLSIADSSLRGILSLGKRTCAVYKWRVMLNRCRTHNHKNILFSRHYLRNSLASDIVIVGYIKVNYITERFREVWQITPETTSIYHTLNGMFMLKLLLPPFVMLFFWYCTHIPLYNLELGHDLFLPHPF